MSRVDNVGHPLLAFGEYVFDPGRYELRRRGTLIKVDPKLLDLLECFLRHPGKLLSTQEILDKVWEGRAMANSALSVTVAKLRKVLRQTPADTDYIENRYGRGYRFMLPVVALDPGSALAEPDVRAAGRGGSAPFVGRAEILQRLWTNLTQAFAGEGSLCALLGEPGIGKTRLAEMLEVGTRGRGIRVAWGRSQAAEGLPPLWPFGQMLRELGERQLADEILQAQSSTEPAFAEASLARGSGFSCDAQNASLRAIDRIAQTLHRASRERPLLLLLDDVQWADAASLRVLDFLISDIARWPIAIVTMQRSTEIGPDARRGEELRRLLSHRNCVRIELPRLPEADIADYVGQLFDGASPALAQAVFTRSEGNPFFMVELLRPWAGFSRPEPEQLRLSELSLDLVRRRLQDLPASVRGALAAASVLGRDFDLGLLGQITGREVDVLLEELDESLANDTVVPSAEVPTGFAFDHELIREVLYNDLPALERCRLHARAGEALVRRRTAGVPIASAELARHFLASLPHGDVTTAIEHARAAAAAATRLGAHREALSLLRRAHEACKLLLAPDPKMLTRLLLELSMVERKLGDVAYVEHVQRAVALARQHSLGPLLALAGRLLSPTPGLLSYADAAPVLEAAAAVLPPRDPQRAAVLAHLAWTPPNCSSARRVAALLDEAEALLEGVDHPDAAASLLEARLYFSAGPATPGEADRLAYELDATLAAHPELATGRAISAATFRLINAMQHGDAARLQRALEERSRVLAKLNNVELNWHHERLLVIMRMNRGDFVGVEAALNELCERGKRLQLLAFRTLWVRDYGALISLTGDSSLFAARARAGLQPAPNDLPLVRSRKIASLVELGFLDDVRSALADVSLEALRDQPNDREYLVVMSDLARASAAVGSREHCSALYEFLRPYARLNVVGISFHCQGSVSHYLGLLAAALGQLKAARAHFEVAVAANTEFGLVPCALASQLELAKLLLLSRTAADRARARRSLATINEAALQLGMQPLARACRELMPAPSRGESRV